MKRHLPVFTAAISRWIVGFSATIAIISVVISMAACSSFQNSPEGTWTATYFENPDRVWNAIELALLDLDYEVVTENREDGVIRAEKNDGDDGTVIALAIDQVMRTEDQVNVYVKPSFGGDQGSVDPGLLKAAADEFVKAVEDKLKG
jgi:hypothetical protein